jgi:ABC-type polysaccharide/polyol phosphate transport system ATPase subunit
MIDLRIRNISKRYAVPTQGAGARRLFGLGRRDTFWAVRDVSFDVRRGETVGVIGPNGAGKTTLIKLISGITAPSIGEIEIFGRLASLVEVGAGFQPDLTGRENIFLNGSIMGMGYREIAKKLDRIVEFAEIGEFLDAPVKRYSSGMFVRLGFAIAAHLDADILLLDEVLAVGDLAFQARCLERIDELRRANKTILLVSHDLAAIERVCDRALLLGRGGIQADGEPREVIDAYLESASTGTLVSATNDPEAPIVAAGLSFSTEDGGPIRTGAPLHCYLDYEARRPLDDVLVRVLFNWPSGYLCTQLASSADIRLESGPGRVEFDCPCLTMQRGLYSVDVLIERHGEHLASRPRCALLNVGTGTLVHGDFLLTCRTEVEAGDHIAEREAYLGTTPTAGKVGSTRRKPPE